MSGERRVMVTGRGLVGPGGVGVSALAAAPALRRAEQLFAQGCDVGEGTQEPGDGAGRFAVNGSVAAQLAGRWVGAAAFDADEMLAGQGNVRLLDRSSSMLVHAAQQALDESALDAEQRRLHEVGLVLGTTFCSVHTIAAFDRRAVSAGPRYASPLDFANTVINAATGQAAIWHDLRGMNSTVAGESASSLEALALAWRALRDGRAEILLVGGVEELSFELLLGLERRGLLDRGEATGSPAPWAADGSGFAPSEGAAVVVLETLESARRRGAPILGEVLGGGVGFDPSFALGAAAGGARERRQAVQQASLRACGGALRRAGLTADGIDLFVAGSNGSPRTDAAEAGAYRELFGPSGPPAMATKEHDGEGLGWGGAQLLLRSLAVLGGEAPPMPGERSKHGFEELAGGRLLGRGLEARDRSRPATALLSTVGWAGHCAAVAVAGAPS